MTKSRDLGNLVSDGASSGVAVYTGLSGTDGTPSGATYLLNASSSAGDLAYVTANTGLYQNNGNGWYKIATVNTSPTISAVQDASSGTTPFTLATDQTPTVITITASDTPDEGTTLYYSYTVSTGSLTNGGGATATVKDASNNTLAAGTAYTTNVFKIVPTSTEAHAGSFSLTFNVTDNINTAQSVNAFTLQFSSPYTIKNDSYDSLSYDPSSGFGSSAGLVFNSTGTRFYYITSSKIIVEYSMSTAYDIANASYVGDYNYGNTIGSSVFADYGSLCLGDNNSKIYFTSYNTKKVHQLNFGSGSSAASGLSWSSSNDYSFSSTQTTYPRGVLWNNNGTVFWLFNDTQNLYEYTTTNWNVSGASHNATISNHIPNVDIVGAFWNDDGTKVFLNNASRLRQYSVSTAYDLGSTLTDDSEDIDLTAQKGSSNYGSFINGDFNRTSTTIGGTSIAAGRKVFGIWNGSPISGGTPYNGTRIFRYSVG